MDQDKSVEIIQEHLRTLLKQFIGRPATQETYENMRRAVEDLNNLGGPLPGETEHIEFKTVGDSVSITPKTKRGEEIIREMMDRLTVQKIHNS